MSKQPGAGGTNSEAGGQNENAIEDETKKDDVVSHATYQRVLTQKKQADEKIATYEKQLKEVEKRDKERLDAELKAKEDFKTIASLKEKELEEFKTKYVSLEQTLQNGLKLDAFLKAVPGKVDDAYFPLISLDEIVIDPNTNRPDPTSVQNAAKEFEKRYPKVIEKASGVSLPNQAASNGSGAIDLEAWKKLPAKEMKAKLAEVMKNSTKN